MPSSLKFVQITDTHISKDKSATLSDCNTYESLSKVLEHIKHHEWPIDGMLATGDLSHDGTEASYRLLHDLLSPLKIPVYCLPGNHDDVSMMRTVLDGDCIISAERILRDDWQLIMVASSVPGKTGGEVSDLQMFAIEKHLQQYPDKPTLVGIHHPPIKLNSPWLDAMSLDNHESFLETVGKYQQVKAIVFGHAHQSASSRFQDILIYGTPSTCTQFKPESNSFTLDSVTAGYRVINLYPDGEVETRVERLGH